LKIDLISQQVSVSMGGDGLSPAMMTSLSGSVAFVSSGRSAGAAGLPA